jgi:hypothetical protein
LLISCLGGLGFLVYKWSIFELTENDIDSNLKVPAGVKRLIENKSLLTLDVEPVSLLILKVNPEYKNIRVLKRFPKTLFIRGQKRIPVIQIKDRKFYQLDSEGVVLDFSNEPYEGLVYVETANLDPGLRRGSVVKGKDFSCLMRLLDELEDNGFLKKGFFPDTRSGYWVKSINITQIPNIYFMLEVSPGGGQPPQEQIKVITGSEELGRKLKALRNLIESNLKDRMKLVKYIDLRYKKLYISFKR